MDADWGLFQRFKSKFGLGFFNDTIVISVLSLVDHTSIQKAGCCHKKIFLIARSLLAHFRCRVCMTAGLYLTAFPVSQRKFRLSTHGPIVYPWRCYQCGVKKEAESINHRRLRQYVQTCAVCCQFLYESPPPYSYMQNSRSKDPRMRRCNRCLHGMPPKLSIELRLTCRDWRYSASRSPVFFLFARNLTEATGPYRCTWRNTVGLQGLVIFLGPKFTRPYGPMDRGMKTSCFIRRPELIIHPRPMKWIITPLNQVIHRVCCKPDWSGWFCHVCNHQH